MWTRGLIKQLRYGFGLPSQISIVGTRPFDSSCVRFQSFSTTDNTNTANNKNDNKESSSMFGSKASTRKLAAWLDATIIKRKGIAFDASQQLMSAGRLQ